MLRFDVLQILMAPASSQTFLAFASPVGQPGFHDLPVDAMDAAFCEDLKMRQILALSAAQYL
jgi:hypothetical protein